MQRQVEKVLQIASLEKEKVDLNIKTLDFHSIISEVAVNFAPLLDQNKGEITLTLKAEKSIVEGDETHLSNIITNLVDNAIKYCNSLPKIEIKTRNSLLSC